MVIKFIFINIPLGGSIILLERIMMDISSYIWGQMIVSLFWFVIKHKG